MAEDKPSMEDELDEAAAAQEVAAAQEETQAESQAEQEASEDPGSALEKALAELEDAKDQVLRAKAETDNVRRRASRDVEKAHKYALEKFAANLLPVIDSLEKAIESIEVADKDEKIETFGEGVRLALKLFLDTLERSGIKPVDPMGEPFDPQFHEAMGMLESAEVEPGTVLVVLLKGYTLNDRLVRAAMVMVSKEPVPVSEAQTDAAPDE